MEAGQMKAAEFFGLTNHTEPAEPMYIDMTPESLKTPEGIARVNAALKAWEDARVTFANLAAQFLSSHSEAVRYALSEEDEADALEDFDELLRMEGFFASKQDAFLRAMANHPPAPDRAAAQASRDRDDRIRDDAGAADPRNDRPSLDADEEE